MKTTAQKWGNSLAIRVPKRVAEEAGLCEKVPVRSWCERAHWSYGRI